MKSLHSWLVLMLLTFISNAVLAKPSDLLLETNESAVALNGNLLFYSKVLVLLLIAFLAFFAYRNWRMEEE